MGKLTVELELEIRNLYLFENRKRGEIADMVGESPKFVSTVIRKLGLVTLRKETRAQAMANAADLVLEHKQRITEALVAQSEQHAITALRKTGEALHDNKHREAGSYSSTARNLVGIARAVGGAVEAATASQVNLFFVGGASVASAEPRNVYADMLD